VSAVREGYEGPIAVELANLPATVTAVKGTIRAGEKDVLLELNANTKAAAGNNQGVTAQGSADSLKATSPPFTIVVVKEVRPAPGFTLLFNGKDLTGWKPDNKLPGNWRVENGVLSGLGPSQGFLYTTRGDYNDFHLRVEACLKQGSGLVFFRSANNPSSDNVNETNGYHYHIQDQSKPGVDTNALCANGTGLIWVKEQPINRGDYFVLEVLAAGDLVTAIVNETTRVEFRDKRKQYPRSGHIALYHERHAVVEFRKIEIKELLALDDAWLKLVAGMAAEKQVAAVADKLKERNLGFDGKVTHKVEGGIVTELSLSGGKLMDIAPVRALTGLRLFNCDNTQVYELSPLKGMKLTHLNCSGTQVSDLSPLKGMPLKHLNCDFNAKRDAEILLWSIKTLDRINGKDAKQLLLANTTWAGPENAPDSSAVTFKFGSNDDVTMTDTNNTWPGKYTLKDDNVRFEFKNPPTKKPVVYKGTIDGNEMSGDAQYQGISWKWKVKKQ
jgi:hypothetical protein